jgi:hypothetical protein
VRGARWLLRGGTCVLLFIVLAPRSPRALPAEAWASGEAPARASATSDATAGSIPVFDVSDVAADSVPVVDWRMLSGLNFRTGQKTAQLEKLQGKRVRIPGFMVPLEDEADGVTEFLLVPYYGACIHTPPPPPNQIVYVRMKKKVRVDMYSPIWVEGPLKIQNTDSYYGTVGYQLEGLTTKPYEM